MVAFTLNVIIYAIEVSNVREGSFAFDLSCFTEDQFKEVWEDYQSGILLQRFQDEFEAHDVKVEGLKVEIKNLKEVKEKMEIINCRLDTTYFVKDIFYFSLSYSCATAYTNGHDTT